MFDVIFVSFQSLIIQKLVISRYFLGGIIALKLTKEFFALQSSPFFFGRDF